MIFYGLNRNTVTFKITLRRQLINGSLIIHITVEKKNLVVIQKEINTKIKLFKTVKAINQRKSNGF